MSKLVEIQNIEIIRNEGKKDEFRHYYNMIDELKSLVVDQNLDEDEEEFRVAMMFEASNPKYTSYKTQEEAQNCANALREVLIDNDKPIHVIDLLSFVKP